MEPRTEVKIEVELIGHAWQGFEAAHRMVLTADDFSTWGSAENGYSTDIGIATLEDIEAYLSTHTGDFASVDAVQVTRITTRGTTDVATVTPMLTRSESHSTTLYERLREFTAPEADTFSACMYPMDFEDA